MFDEEIENSAKMLVNQAIDQKIWITTAESCTGGLITGALTEIAGASACIGSGYVTYSNEAKMKNLGVQDETLANFGAVSEEVAGEMAIGALQAANANLAIAVTGIAGPDGGTADKPVGLVYIAISTREQLDKPIIKKYQFGDLGRSEVRRVTVLAALKLALLTLDCGV